MRIIRGRASKRGFTVLPNATLRDDGLSFRARGILAYLLSHEDGWETSSEEIARQGREGRDAVRSALSELETAGYVDRVRIQDPTTGLWSTQVTVNETPRERPPSVEPTPENPSSVDADFQASDNQSSDIQPSVSQALIRKTNKKDPPSPTASPQGRVLDDFGLPPDTTCPRHRGSRAANCRGCGTTSRQLAARQARQAAAERRAQAAAAIEADRRLREETAGVDVHTHVQRARQLLNAKAGGGP